MGKRAFLTSLIIFVALGLGGAQASEALKAGGWEFGAALNLIDSQDYPIFGSNVAASDKDSTFVIDGAASAGLFIKDNFSIVLKPSVYYMNFVYQNTDGTKDTEPMLKLGFAAVPTYYLPLASNLALGMGGSLGVAVWPGLAYVDNDMEIPDKSLIVSCELEPELSLVVFLAGNMALTVQGGYTFMYMRAIKTDSGATFSYPSGYSMLDDMTGKVKLSLGFRYFLPEGGRFGQATGTSFSEFLGIMGK